MSTITTRPIPRPSYSSNAGISLSTESNKSSRSKENHFYCQHGSKLHPYGRDKAPYPISYDKEYIDANSLDYPFISHLKNNITFIDFAGNTPHRCLDLGTGLGDWVIEAAKAWPDCSFVGYDMMNIQIPLSILDAKVAERIEWTHGNFLRARLPFEDDEFDHVHIKGLAFAVPENKWSALYDEINRVLRPGGTIEQVEDDALFPVLPRWFTSPLHCNMKLPSALFPDGSLRFMQSYPIKEELSHDHALLEFLFNSVFENRFINPTPTSVLPAHFSAAFSHVLVPPILVFPMPPLAPLPPLPKQGIESEASSISSESSPPDTLFDGDNINDDMEFNTTPISATSTLGHSETILKHTSSKETSSPSDISESHSRGNTPMGVPPVDAFSPIPITSIVVDDSDLISPVDLVRSPTSQDIPITTVPSIAALSGETSAVSNNVSQHKSTETDATGPDDWVSVGSTLDRTTPACTLPSELPSMEAVPHIIVTDKLVPISAHSPVPRTPISTNILLSKAAGIDEQTQAVSSMGDAMVTDEQLPEPAPLLHVQYHDAPSNPTIALRCSDSKTNVPPSSTSSPASSASLLDNKWHAMSIPMNESAVLGGDSAIKIIPFGALRNLEPQALYMVLLRATSLVYGVKEAMWEELKDLIVKDIKTLQAYGWEEDELAEDVIRPKFEALINQYRKDMNVRLSLWHCLVHNGWTYPHRDPLTKSELLKEKNMHQAIMEARNFATEGDIHAISRSSRLFVGMKSECE